MQALGLIVVLAASGKAFSTALHAHKTGRYLEAWHLRNDVVIGSLGVEAPYDFNFQRFVKMPQEAELLPGDWPGFVQWRLFADLDEQLRAAEEPVVADFFAGELE